jgi:hypothetical protein
MSLDFTDLALAVIALFGLVGWLRGVRRIAVTTGGIFFAMVVVGLMGNDLISALKRVGFSFHPRQQSDLFLAFLFAFTVYVVQLGAGRAILGSKGGPLTRQQRLSGLSLGLLNGFLLVANVVRYADPYLRTVVDARTGGWTWDIPLPHLGRPDSSSISIGIQQTPITITPSPLLKIYNTLPTALILLFAFLVFVFVGTLYGRVVRGRG